ncbi:MAG: alpha-L-fucosidase [Rhodanobacteraceae bacterium]|nr:alpha-L-fucosidase [Rhodanobacteraceae bacterium]
MNTLPKFCCTLLCLLGLQISSAASVAAPPSPRPSLEQRAAWFNEARFGIIIHYGLYSQLGAVGMTTVRAKRPNGSRNAPKFPTANTAA